MRHALCALLLLAVASCGAPDTGMPRIDKTPSFQYDGTAAEVLQAGSYTYVQVRLADGSLAWAVGLHRDLAVGNFVHVRRFGRRTDFCSRRLERCFAALDFAVLGTPEH